jgi:hypothetical protein
MFSQAPGFEQCEVYTVARFTAPSDALLDLFRHCEVTIRYKTQNGIMRDQQSLYEEFHAAIVAGSGLAPVTLTFKPNRLLPDPIVEAKATDLRCSVDQVFDH